jgi:hypothetical protein
VVLILMNVAVGYRGDGRRRTSLTKNDLLEVQLDLRKRDGQHRQEGRSAEALEARVEAFQDLLSLRRNAEIAPPTGGDPPTIDFPKRKQAVWSAFTDRADRIHLGYPELKDISFDEGSDLTEAEWADRYALLEVLRRVLDAAVTSKLGRFLVIEPGPVEDEGIPDDPELEVIRSPVRIRVEASYPDLLAFIRSFQEDRSFLSIEVSEVRPAGGGGTKVEATLRAVGIDLGAKREDSARSSGGFRRRPR